MLCRPIKDQYSGPRKDCKFWPVFKKDENHGWNNYSILDFENAKGHDEDEHIDVMAMTLNTVAEMMAAKVVVDGYGGYLVDDQLTVSILFGPMDYRALAIRGGYHISVEKKKYTVVRDIG